MLRTNRQPGHRDAYVNELAGQARLAPDGEIDQRIKDAIARPLTRQDSNGSFGLWSVGGDDA